MLIFWRIIIHLGCLAPAMWLVSVLLTGNEMALGADPAKEIQHFLGYTAIIIFCVMFLLGILLQIMSKNQYQILRRPLGSWAFVWALVHVASYFILELGMDFSLFLTELLRRPYLIFGGIAFLILLIMSITSLPALKNKLGKRWFTIHQLAYPAILLAVIHYYWSVKSITLAPILVGVTVAVIILWKFVGHRVISLCKRVI